MQTTVKIDNRNIILCPQCGGDYLHGDVDLSHDSDLLRVHYECEFCLSKPTLRMFNHKGQFCVQWAADE